MEKKLSQKPKKTFEKALAELEEIAANLEDGNFSLDRAVAEFEKAAELVKFCEQKLDEAERKIEILQKKSSAEDGSIRKKKIKVSEDTGEIDEKEDLQGSLL